MFNNDNSIVTENLDGGKWDRENHEKHYTLSKRNSKWVWGGRGKSGLKLSQKNWKENTD